MSALNVVTGATGHLGNVLVRHLVERSRRVRALVQPQDDVSPLADLPVEVAWADVTQPDTLDKALEGADVAFHVAGLVSITRGQRERLRQVNVEGTRNVVEACRRQRVRRLVYVSSVHALAEPRGSHLDETAGFRATGGDYSRSKAEASELVLESARRGLGASLARLSAFGHEPRVRSGASAARGPLRVTGAPGQGVHGPSELSSVLAAALVSGRQHVLTQAYEAHPERFVHNPTAPPPLPSAIGSTTEDRARRGGSCSEKPPGRCLKVASTS